MGFITKSSNGTKEEGTKDKEATTSDTTTTEDKKDSTESKGTETQEKPKILFGVVPSTTTSDSKDTPKEAKAEDAPVRPTISFGFKPSDQSEKKDEEKKATETTRPTVSFGFKPTTTTTETKTTDAPEKEDTKPKFSFGLGTSSIPPLLKTSEDGKKTLTSGFAPTNKTWGNVNLSFGNLSQGTFGKDISPPKLTPIGEMKSAEASKIPSSSEVEPLASGEEHENIIYDGVCFFYVFNKEDKSWIERGGKSIIHINTQKEDETKSRILIRNAVSRKIVLNSSVFPQMTVFVNEKQKSCIRFTAFVEKEVESEESKTTTSELGICMMRFKDATEADRAFKVLSELREKSGNATTKASEGSKDEKEDKKEEEKSEESKTEEKKEEQKGEEKKTEEAK